MRTGACVLPLALTMGDPAGIGLDITLAAYAAKDRQPLPTFVLVACPAAVAERARLLGLGDVAIATVAKPSEASRLFATALPVLALPAAVEPVSPVVVGRPDPGHAAAVVAAIATSVDLAVAGEVAAIVTNPIAKATLYAAGFAHPGHTEYLAELARRQAALPAGAPLMLLAAEELKVVPLTIHIPLADVARAITTQKLIDAAKLLDTALKTDFGILRPRIAVCGLNPHAGESGTIGREEIEIITPALRALDAGGMAVTGPHSADTLFHATARAHYDAVIAMYHDQALIPLKTLAFDRGVNVTLGLPFVRTSPDHGTAFDIAGTGRASPASLIAALRLAAEVAERRHAGHSA